MSWYTDRLCGFDLESTGVDTDTARIVTACIVQCGGGVNTQSASWLSNVDGEPIPDEAARIHGVTTERAQAEGVDLREVVDELLAGLAQVALSGIPIVAMNARYDFTLLDREARRYGMTPLQERLGDVYVIDPFVIDKQMSRRRGSRKLVDLCGHYQVPIGEAHTSDADAIAACRVAWRQGQRYPQLQPLSVQELHVRQIGWAKEQADSLRAYFARTPGKESWAPGVRGEWPLIPFTAGGVAV